MTPCTTSTSDTESPASSAGGNDTRSVTVDVSAPPPPPPPPVAQPKAKSPLYKFLVRRIIDSGLVRRVGSTVDRKVDVRMLYGARTEGPE